ncbi:MAG: thiamine/thiamine pyrophosphate ABC transporter permease ThiP [Devosia sp.]|nr:thiamine/thiamine pyrophosphate ABC transporter permease ThiP [Devosia sp.]
MSATRRKPGAPFRFNRNGSGSIVLPPRPLRLAGGAGIALAIAALVVLILWSIAAAASVEPETARTAIDIPHLLAMTSIQAGLTAVLSITVGTALAWALNRLRFPGRDLVVGLFASAIVTPGIVVAFGLLAVWGRSGWVNALAQAVFGAPLDIPVFGLGGILAAHLILDGAFAARILLTRLDAIPAARIKTGQSLALSAWQRFAVIDWPAIRGTIPGLAAIIFLLAFTSFPVVLLLGGGPANQTLEVAIYTAVRLDFDLYGAVILALVQIGVCATVVLAAAALAPIPPSLGPSRGQRWSDAPPARLVQRLVLFLCVLGFALPLAAILLDGLGGGLAALLQRPAFWRAAGTSLVIATLSAALALLLALILCLGRAATPGLALRTGIGVPAYAYLAVPAVVLALGFFLLVRRLGLDPAAAAPMVVVLANALLALPFAVATLGPPLDAIARSRARLIRSLGLSGTRQFTHIEWPLIGRDAGVVLALAFCFSLGDLGVIALFGTQDFATLPLLMVRALGAYRTNDAAAIAALMLCLTIAAFVIIPRLFGSAADARA